MVELVAGDLLPTPELVAPLRVVQPLPLDLQVRLVAPGSVQINVKSWWFGGWRFGPSSLWQWIRILVTRLGKINV